MDRNRTGEEGGSRRRRVDGGVNKHTGFDDTSTEGRTPTKTQTTTFFEKSNGMVLMVTLLSIYIHSGSVFFVFTEMKQSQSQKLCHPTFLPSINSPSFV